MGVFLCVSAGRTTGKRGGEFWDQEVIEFYLFINLGEGFGSRKREKWAVSVRVAGRKEVAGFEIRVSV